MIAGVVVRNEKEFDRLKNRVDWMRRVGVLSPGCPPEGCTCKTLRESLTCEHWKRVDVI